MRNLFISVACLIAFNLFIACSGEKKVDPAAESDDSTAAVTTTASEPEKEEQKPTNRRGQLIYKQYCVICHGADGKT